MKKKLLVFSLSLLVIVGMIAGSIMVGNAAGIVESTGFHAIEIDDGFNNGVIGQRYCVAYGNVDINTELIARYYVYLDSDYEKLFSTVLQLDFDETKLKIDNQYHPISNGSYQYMLVQSGAYGESNGSWNANIYSQNDAPRSDSNGKLLYFDVKFNFASEAAVQEFLSNANGWEVGIKFYGSEGFFATRNATDFLATDVAEGGDICFKPAILCYAAPYATYNVGKGAAADMSIFEAKPYAVGAKYIPADGTKLMYIQSNTQYVFSHWVDLENGTAYYPNDGKSVVMSQNGIELTAVYDIDMDRDGTPDGMEKKVAFKMRAGDLERLVGREVAEGKFYAEIIDGVEYLCINIKTGEQIGANLPLVQLPNGWKFSSYNINGIDYADAARLAVIVNQDMNIEVRTMPDFNNNGIDDRSLVSLNVYARGADLTNPDAEPVMTFQVIDGAYFIIHDSEGKDGDYIQGYVNQNPTKVKLLGVADRIGDMPFDKWEYEAIDTDGDGIIDNVVIYPTYVKSQLVDLKDIVDDLENIDPKDIDDYPFPIDSYVIHRGIDGSELSRTIITSSTTEIVNPVAGAYAQLPLRNSKLQPFAGWKMTIPTQTIVEDGKTIEVTYFAPIYYGDVPFTAIEVVDDNNEKPLTPERFYVPYDATYQMGDEDGNLSAPKDIKDNPIAKTTADKNMPTRNAAGEVFRGNWTITKTTDPNGKTNFIIVPVYSAVEAGDIEVLIDAVEGEGYGVAVLSGAYRNDNKAALNFYIRVAGEAAGLADADRLTTVRTAVLEFAPYANVVSYITPSISYEGTKVIDGCEYGVFEVVYTTQKSGIVDVSVCYDGIALGQSYYVITVGNVTAFSSLNSMDVSMVIAVVNDIVARPVSGYNAADPNQSFIFELMDVNKSGTINSVDVTELVYMVNGIVESN